MDLKERFIRDMKKYLDEGVLKREELNAIYLGAKNSPCVSNVATKKDESFSFLGFYYTNNIEAFKKDADQRGVMLDYADGTDEYDFFTLSIYIDRKDIFEREIIISKVS